MVKCLVVSQKDGVSNTLGPAFDSCLESRTYRLVDINYAVYKFTNKVNGKFYVGTHKTKNLLKPVDNTSYY